MATRKKIRSISISEEANEIVNNTFHSRDFSKWVEDKILEELRTDLERLNLKRGKLLIEIKKIEDEIKSYEKISKEEVDFFKSAKGRLEINPTFILGILKQYYNLFDKRISREYFYKRMNEALINDK